MVRELRALLNVSITIQSDVIEAAIYEAIRYGHKEIVELLLEQNTQLEPLSERGIQALVYAAFNNNIEVVRSVLKLTSVDNTLFLTVLVQQNNCIALNNVLNDQQLGKYLFLRLMVNNQVETELIAHCKDPIRACFQSFIDNKVLYYGVSNIPTTENHLINEAIKNAPQRLAQRKEDQQNRLMINAIKNKSPRFLNQCLRDGANISTAKDNDNNTPLMIAVASGRKVMVEYFLNHTHDLNAQDTYGNTALAIAVKNKNIELIQLLIERGADVNFKSKFGRNVLYSITLSLHVEDKDNFTESFNVIRLLVSHKADIIFGIICAGRADLMSEFLKDETIRQHLILRWNNKEPILLEYLELLKEHNPSAAGSLLAALNIDDRQSTMPASTVITTKQVEEIHSVTAADIFKPANAHLQIPINERLAELQRIVAEATAAYIKTKNTSKGFYSIFTAFSNTEKGVNSAVKLRDNVSNSRTVAEAEDFINQFLKSCVRFDGKYNTNSCASFLLEKLVKIENSPWAALSSKFTIRPS